MGSPSVLVLPPSQPGTSPHAREALDVCQTWLQSRPHSQRRHAASPQRYLKRCAWACSCERAASQHQSRHPAAPSARQAYSPSSTMAGKAVVKQPDPVLGKIQSSILHLLGSGKTCIWLGESETETHWGKAQECRAC